MTKGWLVVLACLAGWGCGKSDGGGGGGGTAAAGDFAKLSVMVDGKPVAFTRAFIKHKPDGQYQLWLGERGGSCNALLSNVFDGKIQDLLLDLPVQLAPDGKEAGTVTDISWTMPPTDADPGGTSTVRGELTKGSKVEVELAFTGKGGKGEKLEVKGSLVAESCGEQPTEPQMGVPKAAHPSTARMTIAGKLFLIGGAIRKGNTVELVENARECMAAKYLGARVRSEYGSWYVDGKRFAKEHSGKPLLTVTPGAIGTSEDGPVVELELSGEGVIGDYKVKLEGKVEALDCK